MNDHLLELVTAYVDGEATADERAIVEADAELLAEVERHRAVRAALHAVDPPPDSARESAIRAALGVFDHEVADTPRAAASAAPDVTAPTNIVPFAARRRMRWTHSLGAAAALAAVVVAGAVVATRRGNDDGITAVQLRESTPVEFDSSTVEFAGDTAPAAAEVATTEVATSSADELMAAEAPSTAGDAAADAATATDDETVGGAPAAPAPTLALPSAAVPATTITARVVVLTVEDDLIDLASTLKDVPLDADDAAAECTDGALKADAVFEDDDGTTRPIVVVVVDADTLGAMALDDCTVVLEAER